MPTTLLGTGVLGVGVEGRVVFVWRVVNGKGITVEELELAFLVGYGYKWMAAASTVIYE